MRIRAAPFLRCSPIKVTVAGQYAVRLALRKGPCASPIEAASWRSVTSSNLRWFCGGVAVFGLGPRVLGLRQAGFSSRQPFWQLLADLVLCSWKSLLFHHCRFSSLRLELGREPA